MPLIQLSQSYKDQNYRIKSKNNEINNYGRKLKTIFSHNNFFLKNEIIF